MAEDFPPDAPDQSRRRGESSRRRPRRGRRTLPASGKPLPAEGKSLSGEGKAGRNTGDTPDGGLAAPVKAEQGADSAPRSPRSSRKRRGGRRRNASATDQNRTVVTGKPAGKGAARPRTQVGAPASSRPQASRPAPKQAPKHAYAAIDLGTNNCRLLVARPEGDSFIVVDAFSRVVRLGEGLAQTGRLSDAAMDRALGALRVCADKLRRRGVFLARSVATEACRRASNGQEFIERVRRETGIMLDIISAREEARLAVLGCHILLEPGHGPALVFDIGGGSTELVLIEHDDHETAPPRILDFVSIPFGVVSLTESVRAEEDNPEARAERYAEMRDHVAQGFAEFAERIAPWREGLEHDHGPLRLLGTSGTVTTLASVHLGLPYYDRSAVDGCIVPAYHMREITTRLSTLGVAGRREVPCIGRERADLVVAGCAILDTILDLWPANRLGVADRGIREGILRSLIGISPTLGDDMGAKP